MLETHPPKGAAWAAGLFLLEKVPGVVCSVAGQRIHHNLERSDVEVAIARTAAPPGRMQSFMPDRNWPEANEGLSSPPAALEVRAVAGGRQTARKQAPNRCSPMPFHHRAYIPLFLLGVLPKGNAEPSK